MALGCLKIRFPSGSAGSIPAFGTVFGVRLVVVGDGLEAEVICGLLRTGGIKCNHRQLDTGIGAWEAVGIGGPREVLVERVDLEAAREVVAGALGSSEADSA